MSAHHQVDPQARDTPGRAPAAAARAAGRATDLVMLDFDGVLADTRERFCAAMAAGFERLGRRDLASPDRVLALLDDNWFDALTREGLSAADRAVLDDAYKAGLRPYETLPAFPGVAAAVARIARRCPVVVITSGRTEVVNAFLSAHGIDGVRQTVGSDVETSKVRKIGHAIAEYQPARPWYVGDTAGDIVEGRRAGARTIAVAWGWHSLERLLAAGPDHVAHAPAELVSIIEAAATAGPGAPGAGSAAGTAGA